MDEFTDGCLFQMVKGKTNVAIVVTTKDGNVIVGGHTVAVMKQCELFKDPNLVVFTFKSHGRGKIPQRFTVIKEFMGDAGVMFSKNNEYEWFVAFDGADGSLILGNKKESTESLQRIRRL